MKSIKQIEHAINDGEFLTSKIEGILAIIQFNRDLGQISIHEFEKLPEAELKIEVKKVAYVFKLITNNSVSIIPFLSTTINSVKVTSKIIDSSDLTQQQKNDLHNIFTGNIGTEIRAFMIGLLTFTLSEV